MSRLTNDKAQQPSHSAQPSKVGLLQRKCACGTHTVAGGKCDACGRKPASALQRSAAGRAHTPNVPRAVGEVLNSPGSPLDAGARAFMESRFGHDFSRVRVHTDSRAAESARAVSALAYTVGEDIVFASGRYSPGTDAGRRLLAHEMTHVLQQRQSAGADLQGMEIDGGPGDSYEAEADAVAARVMSGTAANPPRVTPYRVGGGAPPRLMRQPDESAPTVCPPPKGPGDHPKAASPKLLGRIFGQTKGDPGEGCLENPYPAAAHEDVCTIGYGQQIRNPPCPILFRETGQPPTKEQRKTYEKDLSKFSCACAGKVKADCKTGGAKATAGKQADAAAAHVHSVVPVDLDQAQFDALVDVTLHHGSIPADFVEAIKKHWCTREGRNYVRKLYLTLAVTPEVYRKAFMKRRSERVWSEEPDPKLLFGPPPPPQAEKAPTPAEKKPPPKREPAATKRPAAPPSLAPDLEPQKPQPSLLPGAPVGGPVAQAAANVNNLRAWTQSLLQKGAGLVGRVGTDSPPSGRERKAFWDEAGQWLRAAREAEKRFRAAGREEAANEVGALLDRVGPRVEEMRTRLGSGD